MSSSGVSCPSICWAGARASGGRSSGASRSLGSRGAGVPTWRASFARAGRISCIDDPAGAAGHPGLHRRGGRSNHRARATLDLGVAGLHCRRGRLGHDHLCLRLRRRTAGLRARVGPLRPPRRRAGGRAGLQPLYGAVGRVPDDLAVRRGAANGGRLRGRRHPLTLVYIGDSFEYSERQIMLGRMSVVTSAALAFSASIGGTVAHFVSWRMMLLGYSLLALAPAGLMFRLDPARPSIRPEGVDRPARFADFLADPRARLVYLDVFVEGFFLWGTVTYLGALAVSRHGLDQFAVGMLIALFGVGTMVGGSLMAPVRRRVSENALAGGGGALMSLAFLALIPRWPWPVFGAAMLLLGLGFVALHTTLQVRATEISAANRGKAFSLFAFSLFVGISAATAARPRRRSHP